MPEIITIGALQLKFVQSKHDTGGSLDMFEMTVPPSAKMPVPHFHRDWEETVFGLTGTVTFTVEGEPRPVPPGESLHIRRGVVHGFTNVGAETARCLVVLTPGILGPEYFRETAAEVEGGKADPQKLKDIMLRHGLVPVG